MAIAKLFAFDANAKTDQISLVNVKNLKVNYTVLFQHYCNEFEHCQ